MLPVAKNHIINKASLWSRSGDNYVAAYYDRKNYLQKKIVTRKELDLVDPRIAAYLDCMLPPSGKKLFDETLRKNVQHWSQPPRYIFLSHDGLLHAGAEITSLEDNPFAEANERTLEGSWTKLIAFTLRDNSVAHYLSNDLPRAEIYVKHAWLDENIPGWAERWHLAETLGVLDASSAHAIFGTGIPMTTTPAIALPDNSAL